MERDRRRRELTEELRTTLLLGRTWRYLRYLHFRDMLLPICDEVRTVLVCGAGRGLAELALAAELPDIDFCLTDIVDRANGYPNYHGAMNLAWQNGIDNVRFSIWNVLQPTDRRFDLVASTEMLEHIRRDDLAARNLRHAADRYVYCLVPFADKARNSDPRERQRVLATHQHFVCGYDEEGLTNLFPDPLRIAGAYFADAGIPFRRKLEALTDDEIRDARDALMTEAATDLRDMVPAVSDQALGIKILARAPGPPAGSRRRPARAKTA